MEQLEGKVAVVTGAASGIGEALADALAGEGMRLMLADIAPDRLDAVAERLRGDGAEVVTRVVDVSKGEEVDALGAATLEVYGAAHVVCNNAGIGGGGQMAELDVDEWEQVLGIDLWGVLHGMRVFLPILVAQDEGHIVNTASVAGLYSPPFMGPYNVAKSGVVALSETAYGELSMSGSAVGVSVLCPGWVRTNIHTAVAERTASRDATLTADQQAVSEAMTAMLASFIENGMDPAEVARVVVDGIRSRRFYLLTHRDTPAAVKARAEAIVEGAAPPVLMPDQL